ncbi:hypothetical protein EMN47_12470 [Prolixibacteraceae bacterium JC049]|nr:hypothetical protein [Prolixibacteraceae bacterium JC049]
MKQDILRLRLKSISRLRKRILTRKENHPSFKKRSKVVVIHRIDELLEDGLEEYYAPRMV